jgi:GNAT superfamily N-acetyltransferase
VPRVWLDTCRGNYVTQIVVQPVANRAHRKRFLNLPWQLYRDDPLWIPPLRANQAELVNYRRHPFYKDADICTFLATKDGEDCGRVAAIANHAHNRVHPKEQRGFIGFFECIDDHDVATALFDAARDWLGERGLPNLRGPVNPSLNYECGLLVENFEMSPTFMMTYNPAYYARLWEQYGFVKAQNLITFIGHKENLQTMEKKVYFVVQEATKRFSLQMRPISRTRFRKDVEMFLDIYNASLENVWGHVPMSPGEVRHVSKNLRFLIVPELTMIAEVDGAPVGAIFGVLDYNPRIKEIDGRLFPFGFLKLLRNRKQIQRVRLVSTNVVPEYQRWGVGVVLAAHLVPPALEYGIHEGEFSWVLESNHLSRKSLERGNLKQEKLHRIYDFLPAKPAVHDRNGESK